MNVRVSINPRRVAQMADTFDLDDIAEILGLTVSEVKQLLAQAGRPEQPWVLRCNKSGRTWSCRSRRAAYRLVCLYGLTQWDWWQA